MPLPTNNGFMSAAHIAERNGAFEPQRANNVILELDLTGIEGFEADTLPLALESFPLPRQTNTPLELPFLNDRSKFAGQAQVEDVDVVFRDFVDSNVALILENWRKAVYDPATGQIGLAANYKKTGTIYFWKPDGTLAGGDDDLAIMLAEGVWPQVVERGQADMAADDVLRMTVTLTIDRLYPIGTEYASSGGGGGGTGNGGGPNLV